MSWAEKAIRSQYQKGLKAFTHQGLAPPVEVVWSGELPRVEAVAQLMTLHDDCLRRVQRKVPGFERRLADLGPELVVAPLLQELSQFYRVPIEEVVDGFSRRDDPEAPYDRLAQPRLESGELDTTALGLECDAEFDRNGWVDRLCTVEGYATPFDPRLPLVRSRIGLRPEGIAWVCYLRPQNFQVARFDSLRLIHQQSNQWCLEFEDWRRRRIAERQNPEPWLDFLDQVREASGRVGFEWGIPTKGRRIAATEAVVYQTAAWTDDERVALTESLIAAAIPYGWDGSDLRIPKDYEMKADLMIDASLKRR